MRNNPSIRFLCELNPKNQRVQEFYNPLTPTQLIKKKPASSQNMMSHRTLFDENDDTQNIFDQKMKELEQDSGKDPEVGEDEPVDDAFLKKIIANKRNPKRSMPLQKSTEHQTDFQPFNFDKKIQVKYPETPHFKNQLLSPFWKFNKDNKFNIQTLQKNRNNNLKTEYVSIDINEDPLLYVSEPCKFFIGLAMRMKEKEKNNEMLMFLKLACYTQPFSEKPWKKYLENLEASGLVRKCYNISKTAFIFNSNEEFAKSYILNGEKCSIALNELRGIVTSINNPDLFEKGVLIQMGKLCAKYDSIMKGVKILLELCIWSEFRLPVCGLIHFLAKFLENIGRADQALNLLKRSFGKNMSKLEIYTLYLEIKNRQSKGKVSEEVIKDVLGYIDFISGQNRYKLYLQIAEIQFQQGNQKYKKTLEQSYFAAKNFCAPGTGCNKALRNIFFSVLRWKKVIYKFKDINDMTFFEENRQKFITQKKLEIYDFSDWKFYLHYGLLRNEDLLLSASKKWPYTGRLIAEWIHTIRLSRSSMEVLRIWRDKVKEVPKSGELWCQGGRIYAEMKDYENASKCFRAAIHFTPQYGDSFLQELRILLQKGKFRESKKLKKLYLVSEPFYGHVFSYLKASNTVYRLSLANIWEEATNEINSSLYSQKTIGQKNKLMEKSIQLTALESYNQAVQNPDSQQVRVRFFHSYEQVDSRN